MALPVSAAFSAAEKADAALISEVVYLVLGNYASTAGYGAVASSSGDDASGNYPAAGAIDGDRTEINIGAPSAADNGIGKSSWKSSGIPSNGDYVWLQVDLGVQRTYNRVKLYHRNAHGCKSYLLESSVDGAAWDIMAATSDNTGGGDGYGEGGFGDGPYGGGQSVSVTTTMQLDTIDTAVDFTGRYIRIIVANTQVAGEAAEIVALELYRKIDITSRCIGVDIDRQQDYKLKNNMASVAMLDLSNTDRFFSPKYTPTAAEVAAGWVNSELRPGLGIICQLGFYGVTVSLFVGTVDTINTKSRNRTATITARDGIKGLINNVVSTKLKTSADIGTNVQYLLNVANISNYEMSVDNTTIILDYFFASSTSILTTIQQLAQACGDANFRFDENGKATFRMYMNAVTQSQTDTTQADFQAATKNRNIDVNAVPGQIQATFATAVNAQIQTSPNPLCTITGGGSLTATGLSDRPYGTYQAKISPTSGTQGWWFLVENAIPAAHYRLEITSTQLKLIKRDHSASDTTLLTVARAPAAGDIYKVTRDNTGLFTIYVNSVSLGTVTDNAFASPMQGMKITSTGTCTFEDVFSLDASSLNHEDAFPAYIESRAVDMTAGVTSLGALSADYSTPGGSSVTWYTATSADGVTWDAWVAATIGLPIASAVKRYIKYKAIFNIPLSVSGGTTPIIYDVTIAWSTGTGTAKYPSTTSYTFRYDGALLNVEQEVTDDLGGDTAVYNSIQVASSPLLLSGADTDTQWQATANVPAAKVSTSNPIAVVIGTYTYHPVIAGGMDTTNMSGANPTAAVVAFGSGAVGSWSFSLIHPTTPTLTVVITTGGTITDLRLTGKAFSNNQTPIIASASDAQSIALYDKRNFPLVNNYLINSGVAQSVANRLLSNFKAPTSYIKTARVQLTPSVQVGDRCTLADDNTGLATDFIAIEVRHMVNAAGSNATAYTDMKLMLIV